MAPWGKASKVLTKQLEFQVSYRPQEGDGETDQMEELWRLMSSIRGQREDRTDSRLKLGKTLFLGDLAGF
jgi:hypothetical protein